MDDWAPEPQAFGWLEPPRKVPPGAVAVATPPPPREPFRRSRRSSRLLLKRGALIAFALVTAGAGVAAGVSLPLDALLEIGAGLSALEIATRLVHRRHRRSRRFARVAG
jgi:hypothetical protein